ncbi:dirigent protein 1 [Cryptomeria japonica]|uniref:dirigent protein 1 n=1 Tax=Cryptomeria japonica TaxID=3369 RepID=UPI0025AD9A20|nr:dirigent protein 1 [Cryptomeria japonica]
MVVAGVNGTSSELLSFGTVLVMDDLLTEGPSRFSSVVGRAKGMQAGSDVKGKAVHLVFSAVFENKKYNGSTLQFHGTDLWTKPSGREVSVVGGTGKLRYARGYSIVTQNTDPDDYVGYIKFNTTFRVD